MKRLTSVSYPEMTLDFCTEVEYLARDFCPGLQKHNRLFEYEETGLTPEQVTALKQELIDERHRHDLLQDFEVAEAQKLADMKEKLRWIPVTERLPEQDGQYLCNYRFGKYRDMTFTRVLDYYATDEVPHFQHTLGDSTMKVTHWMPLPKPPKEER